MSPHIWLTQVSAAGSPFRRQFFNSRDPHQMSAKCQKRTFTSLFEGLIGPRSNLHSYFAQANDLGKFRGM